MDTEIFPREEPAEPEAGETQKLEVEEHKPRKFSRALWTVVTVNVLALLAVLTLAYSAGRWSGGLSMLDFGALPSAAGFRLWAAALCVVIGTIALVWMASRVLDPLQKLVRYSQAFDATANERPELPDTGDDFLTIAIQLRDAAERLDAAETTRQRLSDLEGRIASFAEEAMQLRQGDVSLRVAEADGKLGEAFQSLNATLDVISRVLESARKLAEHGTATAQQSVAAAQQVGKTLVQQQSEIAAATKAFDVLPPSIKQVQDNSDALLRAAHAATAGTDQGRQHANAVNADLQRMATSLTAVQEVLGNLRNAAEEVSTRLRALSTVTERANLLALNAAIEAARAGQAGRTSWIFAEQFRDLAQQSNATSAELEGLMHSIQRDCSVAVTSVEQNTRLARESGMEATKAAQAAEAASTAIYEASARAEVVGIASARQADAARAVSSAIQSGSDLNLLAEQKSRQATAVVEEIVKLQAELNAALGVVRSAPAAEAGTKARATTAGD